MTSTILPLAGVRGPARTPLGFGLFSVMTPRTGTDRWEIGVNWQSIGCETAGGIGAWECDPETVVGLPKDFDDSGFLPGEASAFTIYGRFKCAPVGVSPTDAAESAEAHLVAREEARVEQALWTGDLGNVPNFAGVNGYAAPTDLTPAGGAAGLAVSLALLENHLATVYGSLGVLHMTRGMATRLVAARLADARGGRVTTALGTPVVAGAGYTGSKIVATPAVFGYRSEIFGSSNRPGDLLDRATNDLYAVAERSYLVGFDPCGLASINVAEPVTEGGGV